MQQRKPPDALAQLLNRYEAMCGVIETVFLDLEGRNGQADQTHREAAISTLRVLRDRADQNYLRMVQFEAYKNCKREEFYSIHFDSNLLKGDRISLDDFFGSGFDLQQNRFSVRWIDHGFAYAFSDPPYGMRGTAAEINDLFVAIADQLFDGFRSNCTLFEWSTDWSNYFDAGNEWWGSFLWTVYLHGSSYIVGIAASATD